MQDKLPLLLVPVLLVLMAVGMQKTLTKPAIAPITVQQPAALRVNERDAEMLKEGEHAVVPPASSNSTVHCRDASTALGGTLTQVEECRDTHADGAAPQE